MAGPGQAPILMQIPPLTLGEAQAAPDAGPAGPGKPFPVEMKFQQPPRPLKARQILVNIDNDETAANPLLSQQNVVIARISWGPLR